ncbi:MULTISPECIES: ABC transporter permease [Exiguobacterium]|uniref:ABC transporter permease n=1 Tax=Exiguobacterium TaxID=33986 RepID=UPI001BECE3DB|nr:MULTISPECIES: ABC transporter permease [Exiguobacterium]MCT4782334.1 ABC transporter permease [Exiguobacterium himgiriensis]
MTLGLKEMWRKRRQFGLILFITLAIVLLTTLITGLADGLAYDNGATVRELDVDTFHLTADADGQLTRSFIEGTPNAAMTPLAVKPLTFVKGSKQDATLFALPKDSTIGPALNLSVGEVLVDPSFLETYAIGDTVEDFASGYRFTITGVTDGRFSHGPVVWTTMETWNAYQKAAGGPSYVSAWLGDGDPPLTKYSKQDIIESVPGYSAEQGTFTMMRAFLLVIGAFILTAFFYMVTLQKLPQLGILKAIGIRSQTIGVALISQVLVTVVMASLVATFVTLLATQIVPDTVRFKFELTNMTLYSALFVIISVLGTVLPLQTLRRLDAADALGGRIK